MSVALEPVDLSSAAVGTQATLSWAGIIQSGGPVGVRAGRATLRLLNESGAGLKITLASGKSDRVPAGGWFDYQLSGESQLIYSVEYILPGAPVALLLATIYEPGEPIPPLPALGNSPIGVSGNVQTSGSGGTSFVKNDGAAPATSTYETTPSDQSASSNSDNNDGSGFKKILSAGVLRTVWNIVRGNATTGKASVQIGDSADTSITTFYGTVAAGSVVQASTINGTLPASQVGSGYPGANISGNVPNATNAAALGSAFTAGHDNSNMVLHANNQVAGTPQGFGVSTWDGGSPGSEHFVQLVNPTGGFSATVPAGNISGAVANANAVPASGVQAGNLVAGMSDHNGLPLKGQTHFAGTGAGTYNHNYATTPNDVSVTSTETNSTMTVGIDSITSSTVHVNLGQAWPFSAVAVST